jgi:hypothetical protein
VIDCGQPGDGAKQRALAASGWPKQNEELAVTDID